MFCALVPGREPGDELAAEIKAAVARELGKAFQPDRVLFVSACRRREAPRSCGVRCGRRRSGPTRATCRHSRTPRPWRRSPMPSESRTALVTGGGRGIGAGIARALAEDGWSVVVGARSRDQIEEVAQEIGGRAVELDVADRESVERAVAEAGMSICSWRTRVSAARGSPPGRPSLRIAARPRGQRPGRPSVVPSGDPGDARAWQRTDRDHRQRCRLPAGNDPHGLPREQGGRVQVRRDAPQRARRPDTRFLLQPGVGQDRDDERLWTDAPWTPPELAPKLVVALAFEARTRSALAATSTPSTTTSRT